MHTYHALYKSRKIEVEAETSFAAQKKAAGIFKARRYWEVDVYLVALAGAAVVNSPSILPGA